jgi:hypothetical protein
VRGGAWRLALGGEGRAEVERSSRNVTYYQRFRQTKINNLDNLDDGLNENEPQRQSSKRKHIPPPPTNLTHHPSAIHDHRPPTTKSMKAPIILGLRLLALEPLCSALSTKPLAILENRNVPGLQNGMDYVKVGSSDLVVSKVCMGTMTFGEVSSVTRSLMMLISFSFTL